MVRTQTPAHLNMRKSQQPFWIMACVCLAGGLVPQPTRAEAQHSATPAQTTPAPREQAALNSVQQFEYALLPGGNIAIKLGLKHVLPARPARFVLHHPAARIALDLPNTMNELGRKSIAVNQGVVRSVHLVQVKTDTRLVIDLLRPVGSEIKSEGNSLLIILHSPEER